MSEDSGNTSKRTAGLIPWQPGKSGNPSGRPKGSKGLAARIRDRTRDGEDVLDVLMSVLTGEEKCTPRDRLDAAKILLDRGWGKAIETQITVSANSMSAELAAEMADSHLEALARQLVTSVLPVSTPAPRLPNPAESLAIVVDERGSLEPKVPPAPAVSALPDGTSPARLVSGASSVPPADSKDHATGGEGG